MIDKNEIERIFKSIKDSDLAQQVLCKDATVHHLKTVNPYFKEVYAGLKKFEVRENDRKLKFKKDDIIVLCEYNPDKNEYSGRVVLAIISFILDDPSFCKDGFVIFSFLTIKRYLLEGIPSKSTSIPQQTY